ncbi:hypothetical protein [Nonomuraea dietziae]|uniref:Uncharacterized protein n=1 Tax=Nonomuraea dietziae TaxID=65515 RepID=A0A7W5YT46_9ACTN|nr:hypothetical protein [Nonomuraea dietziae]MBB3729909.1 hypothetical protein [Nonomuraea dietziae]
MGTSVLRQVSSGATAMNMYVPPVQYGTSSEPEPCCTPGFGSLSVGSVVTVDSSFQSFLRGPSRR